jgi:hypothetical protein
MVLGFFTCWYSKFTAPIQTREFSFQPGRDVHFDSKGNSVLSDKIYLPTEKDLKERFQEYGINFTEGTNLKILTTNETTFAFSVTHTRETLDKIDIMVNKRCSPTMLEIIRMKVNNFFQSQQTNSISFSKQ